MEKSDKKKLPALLFCWFLGWFGAHRFYLGKTKTALLMPIISCGLLVILLVTVLFLPEDASSVIFPLIVIAFVIFYIWILVDLIRIISGNLTDSQGRELKDWK